MRCDAHAHAQRTINNSLRMTWAPITAIKIGVGLELFSMQIFKYEQQCHEDFTNTKALYYHTTKTIPSSAKLRVQRR